MMNIDLLYHIGLQIDNSKDFYNYIITFKDIRNKEKLIKHKKVQFLRKIVDNVCDNIITFNFDLEPHVYELCEREYVYHILPNNVREGLFEEFIITPNNTKQLIRSYNFKNGMINGSCKTFVNNMLYSISNYEDNIKHGIYQEFYQDGSIYKQFYYNKDVINGPFELFDENGKIEKLMTINET
jgi:antitoxin component YwqK of YwqJK toxin-antitoxin module